MKGIKPGAVALMILAMMLAPISALAESGPAIRLLPKVAGTPETRSTPFIAWYEDLGAEGYVEEEFVQEGKAAVYRYVDDENEGRELAIALPAETYRTRLLVRRPASPEQFNGTVYVEILNPTAGWDGDPFWQNTHDYMMRGGAAYVGISSKPVTVNFLRDTWGEAPGFVKRNRSRYASLLMPYFGQVWDVITDTLTLLRAEDSLTNPLKDLVVQRVILVGYSQSVDFQVTYANHFHQDELVSGYFLAAGGEAAKRINVLDGEEEHASGDARNKISVAAPVVRFQTQTEVLNFGAYRVRQHEPADPQVRFYEMAGGAHVDVLTGQIGGKSMARDLLASSFSGGCELAINPVPIGVVQSALLKVLNQWLDGVTPPESQFITLDESKSALMLDADGNAMGGLRPPALSAPLGQYLGSNKGAGFCYLIGGFLPFTGEQLMQRYGTRAALIDQYQAAIHESVRNRFLLPEDVATLNDNLEQYLDGVWPEQVAD